MPAHKTPSAPAAILFDLDGTLLDSAPDLVAAAEKLRAARGLAPLPFADYRPWCSTGARGLVQVALGIDAEHPSFPLVKEEFLANYEQNLAVNSVVFPGIPAVLDQLAQLGIPWGIVTNKWRRFAAPLLAQTPALKSAQVLVCGDDTPYAKPHPAPLQLAASQLDLGLAASACWYVGDDVRDIEAAQAAAMTSVAVAWGYLREIAIADWGADFVIQTPKMLQEIILAANNQ